MIRIITALLLSFSFFGAWSQVEMRIQEASGDVGDTVNVTLYATRAFDLVNFSYPISFDNQKFEYVGFANAIDADISIDDTDVANGQVGVSYQPADIDPVGNFREDFVDLRFVIGGGCRSVDSLMHEGDIVDFSTMIVNDDGVLSNITADYFGGPIVTQCTRGEFTIEDQTVAPGDAITVPVFMTDLESIVGIEFNILYDPAILEFTEATDKLFGSAMDIRLISPGDIKVLWFDNDVAGVDILVRSLMANLQFNVLGDCGSSSLVEFIKGENTKEISVLNDSDDILIENGIYTDGLIRVACGPEAEVTVTDVDCFGESTGSIILEVTGGVPPYTFEWDDGAITQNRTNIEAGTYQVVITDANNETLVIEDIVVSESPEILGDIDIQGDCESGDVTVSLAVTGGDAPYEINWSNGDSGTPIVLTDLPTVLSVTITDVLSCERVYSNIEVPNLAEIVLETEATNVSCFGGSDGAINLSINGGTGPYDIQWQGPNGFSSTMQNISDLAPGLYSVNVTDQNDCNSFTTVEIIAPSSELIVGVDTDPDTGSGNGTATALPSGGVQPYTFEWSCTDESGAIVENLSAGDCCVTVTDQAGCEVVECFEIQLMESTTELEGVLDFRTYPNPVSNEFFIALTLQNSELLDIEVFNNLGQRMYYATEKGSRVEHKINAEDWPAQMYIVRLINSEGQAVQTRIIKE